MQWIASAFGLAMTLALAVTLTLVLTSTLTFVTAVSSLRGGPKADEAIQELDMKQPAIYILASKKNGTLYTGVTSNLIKRVYQHKFLAEDTFVSRYGCKHLVYFESFETMEQAILREKQIKGGSRKKKIKLIEAFNPSWKDLYDELLNEM